MQSKPSLGGLPRASELSSNSLGDIQKFLDRYTAELDTQWKLLHQDVATPQLAEGEFIYFGFKNEIGTFRMGRVGDDWVLDHQTTTIGTWVNIDTAKGS